MPQAAPDRDALRRLLRWWTLEHEAAQEADRVSEVTFQRGAEAIEALLQRPELEAKRALFFGSRDPGFGDLPELEIRDEGLNEVQREAVARASCAEDAFLLHGPPGTGKTRTLVEIARQSLRLRRRILITAASNVAVDNVTRRLAGCGVKVLRLGSREVISADLTPFTFHHKIAQLDEAKEAQTLFDRAKRLGDAKGRKLRREAHTLQNAARAKLMRRARVVCATAGGVGAVRLGDEKFDLVLLDEATQAPDPVALEAIRRGAVVVLAGDPQQLPPTVITQDEEAMAGLTSTLFERCSARWPQKATMMLTTQYRMPEELMRFPSLASYQGRLEAGAANRAHRLQDLVQAPLSERDGRPWILIDTRAHVGAERERESGSYDNPAHAELVLREVKRLVAAGVAPSDVAAICPYSAQAERLRAQLEELVELGLEIGTVDGFQGREKEVVIVDLVRSNTRGQLGFLRDVRRTNVAITRAKRQLILIASSDTIRRHPYYRDLLAAAQSAGVVEQATAQS